MKKTRRLISAITALGMTLSMSIGANAYVHAWSYTLQYSSTTPESGTHYANNGNAFAGLNARVREYFPGSLTSNQSVMGETKAF